MSSLPGRIFRRLGRPAVVSSIASVAWRVSKEHARFQAGEISAAELRRRMGGHVGSVALGSSTAMLSGAMVGSVFPGVGTALGAFAGGILGDTLGSAAGKGAVRWVEDRRSQDLALTPLRGRAPSGARRAACSPTRAPG